MNGYDRLILATPGLAGYWPMGEPGGCAEELSGQVVLNALSGGTIDYSQLLPDWVNGAPAYRITSPASANSGGLVRVGAMPGMCPKVPDGFAIECWASTTTNGSQALFDTHAPRIALYLLTGPQIQGFFIGTSGSFRSLQSATVASINNGVMHHFVFTAAPNTGRMEIWLDGSLLTSQTVATTGVGTWATFRYDAGWMRNFSASGQTVNGPVQRCALYTRLLDGGTIREHYAAGTSDLTDEDTAGSIIPLFA